METKEIVAITVGVILFIGFLSFVIHGALQTKDFERRLEESRKDGTLLSINDPEELMKNKKYDKHKNNDYSEHDGRASDNWWIDRQ